MNKKLRLRFLSCWNTRKKCSQRTSDLTYEHGVYDINSEVVISKHEKVIMTNTWCVNFKKCDSKKNV